MQTVNELDYAYRKLVVSALEKRNNTIDISDEEYAKYYEVGPEHIEPTPGSDIPIPGEEDYITNIEWYTHTGNNNVTIYENHYFTINVSQDEFIGLKCNYNSGKSKLILSNKLGVSYYNTDIWGSDSIYVSDDSITLSDETYYIGIGQKILTATYQGFTTTNELIVNVIEEETKDEEVPEEGE